jgi:ABC-type multidrug transport system ATPase subunit
LDEPTTGVDPVSRKEFWGMLLKLKQQDITILVSTPYMDEAKLCDRIALMQGGRFLEVDTPQHIIDHYPETLWSVRAKEMHRLLGDLRSFPGVKTSFSFGETYHITLGKSSSPESLQRYLEERGHRDVSIQPISPSVEDCFMLLSK